MPSKCKWWLCLHQPQSEFWFGWHFLQSSYEVQNATKRGRSRLKSYFCANESPGCWICQGQGIWDLSCKLCCNGHAKWVCIFLFQTILQVENCPFPTFWPHGVFLPPHNKAYLARIGRIAPSSQDSFLYCITFTQKNQWKRMDCFWVFPQTPSPPSTAQISQASLPHLPISPNPMRISLLRKISKNHFQAVDVTKRGRRVILVERQSGGCRHRLSIAVVKFARHSPHLW